MRTALFINRTGAFFKFVEEALTTFSEVKLALNFEAAKEMVRENNFDLVIVEGGDLESALQFSLDCRKHFQTAQLPLMYLSAERSSEELVKVFGAGFDDYLAMPFESVELRVRVEARFKKLMPSRGHEYFWRGDLRFAVGQQRVVVTSTSGERDLGLTPNEFRILYLLATNEKKVLSREHILKEVWGENLTIISRTVDKHICALRRKLADKANYVISYPLQGYCFEAIQPVTFVYDQSQSLEV
jgi:DNA-binding response OmpR family regulator